MTKKRSSKKNVKTAAKGRKKPTRKPAKKKSSRAPAKKKPVAKKARSRSSARPSRRRANTSPSRARRSNDFPDTEAGDLQRLSRAETVDSESVDELLEEGNAFEAGVVSGVEEADDSDTKEVRTREVPEDDVPEEYLDQD